VTAASISCGKRPPLVSHSDQGDAGFIDRLQASERVLGIVKIAVEEMLGVENRFVEVLFQERNRVVEDFEIFVERNPERLAHVHVPGLATTVATWSRCAAALEIAIAEARTPERRVEPKAAILA